MNSDKNHERSVKSEHQKSLNIKSGSWQQIFLLSYRLVSDVKLIRFDANNVDKKQQQKFIEWTSIKLPKLIAGSDISTSNKHEFADNVKFFCRRFNDITRDQPRVLTFHSLFLHLNKCQIKNNLSPLNLKCATYQFPQLTARQLEPKSGS